MATGTVKEYNRIKGFGYITDDEDGENYYVIMMSIEKPGFKQLEPGERVTYEIGKDLKKGIPAALHVKPL